MNYINRKVYFMFLILIVFFSACQGIVNNNTDEGFLEKSAKEFLDQNIIYYVDSSENQYIKYFFKNNYIIAYRYETKEMRKLKSMQTYEIYYNSDTELTVIDKNSTKECSFITCENDNYIVISCDDKKILLRGWRTLKEAIKDDNKTLKE